MPPGRTLAPLFAQTRKPNSKTKFDYNVMSVREGRISLRDQVLFWYYIKRVFMRTAYLAHVTFNHGNSALSLSCRVRIRTLVGQWFLGQKICPTRKRNLSVGKKIYSIRKRNLGHYILAARAGFDGLKDHSSLSTHRVSQSFHTVFSKLHLTLDVLRYHHYKLYGLDRCRIDLGYLIIG